MGRPKKQEQAPEPEDVSQEAPDDDALTSEQSIAQHDRENFKLNGQKPISGAEAVRRAVAHGLDAPDDILDFVKKQFGMDIPKPQISSYKSQEKARAAKAGGTYNPTPRMPAPAQSQAAGIPSGFGGDVKELRALMEKVGGADELSELIGQLSGLMGKYGASGLNEIIEALG